MTDQVIGWESEDPVPNGHQFNDYLRAVNGRLYFHDFDLTQLFESENALGRQLPSPLEVVYLPRIRQQVKTMNQVFADVIAELGYAGQFHYAYASKANAAEEVIRATLQAGAHHEMSSSVDVDIAQIMCQRGLLKPERMILSNGFKPAGSEYAHKIVHLKDHHDNVIPIIEDLTELSTFLTSGKQFELGIRQKTYGRHTTREQMEAAHSRFGLDIEGVWKTADYIAAAPNLSLKMYHGMVGSQMVDPAQFVDYLTPSLEVYAQLKQRHPSLSIFNWGGGTPVAMTLDFEHDYHEFARILLTTIQDICARYNVDVPDVMGEFGRYTTAEHGAHLFRVITAKENNSDCPWYIIDGSIMSSFPDSWALSEHFIALPLNHLDQPFQIAELGGITCDSDDVYPPKPSNSPLYLPVQTDNLYVGFFAIGAYQEMLGGVRGSKHCVLPEAYELIIDRNEAGEWEFEVLEGQTTNDVLNNLGYQ